MMVICTIMRMLPGMWLRIRDTKKLEKAVTSVSATHITRDTFMLEVTARAEQIPRICRAMGLLSKMGLITISLIFMAITPPRFSGWREIWRSPLLPSRSG